MSNQYIYIISYWVCLRDGRARNWQHEYHFVVFCGSFTSNHTPLCFLPVFMVQKNWANAYIYHRFDINRHQWMSLNKLIPPYPRIFPMQTAGPGGGPFGWFLWPRGKCRLGLPDGYNGWRGEDPTNHWWTCPRGGMFFEIFWSILKYILWWFCCGFIRYTFCLLERSLLVSWALISLFRKIGHHRRISRQVFRSQSWVHLPWSRCSLGVFCADQPAILSGLLCSRLQWPTGSAGCRMLDLPLCIGRPAFKAKWRLGDLPWCPCRHLQQGAKSFHHSSESAESAGRSVAEFWEENQETGRGW